MKLCKHCRQPITEAHMPKAKWKHTNGFVTCLDGRPQVMLDKDGNFLCAEPGEEIAQ